MAAGNASIFGGNAVLTVPIPQSPDTQLGQIVTDLQGEIDYLTGTVVGQPSSPTGALSALNAQASPPYDPNASADAQAAWSTVNGALNTALTNTSTLTSKLGATKNSLSAIIPNVTSLQTSVSNLQTHLGAIYTAAGTQDTSAIIGKLNALSAIYAAAGTQVTSDIIKQIAAGVAAGKAPLVTTGGGSPVTPPPGTSTTTTTTTATAAPISYGTILAGIAAVAAVGGGIWWYTKYRQKGHSRSPVPARDSVASESPPPSRPPMFPPTSRSPMQTAARSAGSARAHARLLPGKR